MASKDELHNNEAAKNPSKIDKVKKFTNLAGESCVVLPRIVRIYVMDNNAADSSSDEEENLQGEKSKQHKRICHEIIIKNGKTKVISKWMSSKEKKDTKVIQENLKKYRGVRLRKWRKWVAKIRDGRNNTRHWLGSFDTAVEAALSSDKAAIEIRVADALKKHSRATTKGNQYHPEHVTTNKDKRQIHILVKLRWCDFL